jgi:phospholipid/cholesterol/gamma-HCH transport system ATP-binding protein
MTPANPPLPVPADHQPVGIEVRGLSKSFGTQSVLSGVNLSIQPGEIFVIMGPSGSGKSILLRQIAGLDRPSAGQVLVGGLDPAVPEARARLTIALVFQAGALFNSLSVFDNLAFFPTEHRLYDRPTIREKVMETLRILSLDNAAHKFPSELSGGMKKRVAIARALVMEPQVLLYDEPTSELDPVMSATITEVIATLRHTTSVTSIVVTHDRDLALTIADRVAILFGGRIHAVETPDGIRDSRDPLIRDFLHPEINLEHPRFKQLESANE